MSKKSTKEVDQFLAELERIEPNGYEGLGKYLNQDTYVYMKHCTCGKTFHMTRSQFKSGKRCPFCS